MEHTTKLVTLTEASRVLEVNRETIYDLVRLHKIPTQAVSSNAMAKGLAPREFAKLKRLLNLKTSKS